MRTKNIKKQTRQGVVLIVVLALLALFAIVGVTFVLYAQLQADQARIFREAQTKRLSAGPGNSPELLLAEFLRQLVYDVNDDTAGAASALRGHSLARTMYGWNSSGTNAQAFCGVGRLHHTHSGGTFGGMDDFNLVNYTYVQGGPCRDPERPYGTRGDPSQAITTNFIACNASYTYPDSNNMYLAAVKADGTVITPSYHRPAQVVAADWTSGTGRYKILRPRQVDMGAGFPAIGDTMGDVKNLVGAPGGNDSVWLYIGSPVGTLPDGRKYVPMFAPLVVDLDNRINLNAVGNLKANNDHGSNQGWGPWEVNLAKVMTQGVEWKSVFQGNGSIQGRYGPDQQPGTGGTTAGAGAAPYNYSQVDFDAFDEINNVASGALRMPTSSTFLPFPTFPNQTSGDNPGGWNNGSSTERTNHPLLYNALAPSSSVDGSGNPVNVDDLRFEDVNMMALIRDLSTTDDVKSSDLGKLCPNNFDNLLSAPNGRLRNLVTTRSFDYDQAGFTPHIFDPTSQPYVLATNGLYPSITTATTFPSSYSAPPANSGFDSNWRSVAAPLGKVDLNRRLTAYPLPDAKGEITDTATFQTAEQERQKFAKDIYDRLVKSAGADPNTSDLNENNGLRWLAQLAVNIVDYIDEDNFMTPFKWSDTDPDPMNHEWVFGTELPRLVLNEVYSEVQNHKDDVGKMMAADDYQVKFWVELHNPLPSPARTDSTDDGAARLYVDGSSKWAAYKILITEQTGVSNIRSATNVTGDIDTPGNAKIEINEYLPDTNKMHVLSGDDLYKVLPANGNFNGTDGSNTGFYLIGPADDNSINTMGGMTGPAVNSKKCTLYQDGSTSPNRMYYTISNDPTVTDLTMLPKHAVVLRRLACPALPEQSDKTMASYNPYITVDYLEDIVTYDGVEVNKNAANAPAKEWKDRFAMGKFQPYASEKTQLKNQEPAPVLNNEAQHTFFRHNSKDDPANSATPNQTIKMPFDWLVHADRQLISPMELLQVSAYKPHELTQQFVVPNAAQSAFGDTDTVTGHYLFAHRAPWYDETSRIHRFLEMVKTKNRSANVDRTDPTTGIDLGSRIPGKVNINTIWDQEIFSALCDAQTANGVGFTQADVSTMFTNLLNSRTPGHATNTISATDKPFLGLGAGFANAGDPQYPNGNGINNTFLRSGTAGGDKTTARLLETTPAGSTHPYLKALLMNKLYNNVTTRSNVFAVWLTVGFFEVVDDTTQPIKLGAEIDVAIGKNKRHHMFAIVDRSALTIPNTTTSVATVAATIPAAGVNTINVTPGASWSSVQAGSILTIDQGADRETVEVMSVTGNSFKAKFLKPHQNAGFSIYSNTFGNPGPQPNWMPRDNGAVCPYYLVVD